MKRVFDSSLMGRLLDYCWQRGLLRHGGWSVEKALTWWGQSISFTIPGRKFDETNIYLVPADQMLCFDFAVHQSSYGHIPDLVSLEIEERTPFNTGEVIGAYQITQSDTQNLTCHVAMLPRRQLSPAVLQDYDYIDFEDQFCLPLDNKRTTFYQHKKMISQRRTLMAGLAVLFLFSAAYVPALLSTNQLSENRELLTAEQQAAKTATTLQKQLTHLQKQQTLAQEHRQKSISRLYVLSQLGKQLDQTMSFDHITIRQNDLGFSGDGDSAAEVITRLEEVSFLENIDFDSSVKLDANGRESFSLKANLNEDVKNVP